MSIVAAAVGAVLTFVFGQVVQRFLLAPLAAFHKERGDLSYLLLYYQAKIANFTLTDEARDELKQVGAAIISEAGRIPAYDSLSKWKVFRLPPYPEVIEAIRELNFILNSSKGTENYKALKRLGVLLRIESTYAEITHPPSALR
jgi:hypothetical protein